MGATTLTQPKAARGTVRILRRTLLLLTVLAAAAAAISAAWLYWRSHACLPQLDGVIQLPGLAARVRVLRDTRGVPHLRAQSLEDLFFAQGYVTAQDRLWQMDLERRLADGQLSELFGERTLRLDIDNRTLGLELAADRAVAELDPEQRRMLTTYARGVNAFISSHQNLLPIEFALLRYKPRPWREADSFAVGLNLWKTLSTTWPDELMRERVRAKLTSELYSDVFPDRSPLDQPVAESASTSAAGSAQSRLLPEVRQLDPTLAALLPIREESPVDLGSNNWVVNGTHTRTGKPLLANDPHLAHSIPSVWYMAHLKAPGFNVSGVSLPGMPAVIIGHNERIAWGVTNTGTDVQDLYTESFNFRDPQKYLYQGQWVNDEERDEVIKVRHARDYRFTIKVTRHGPVVSHEGGRDLVLQWTALAPNALRFAFLKINQAGNWREFTNALRGFAGPTQNFVYADVDGNIGYYTAGWIPIRKQGDGTVPPPGSGGDYGWSGTIPFESLPHAYNPPAGIIATANGRIAPDGYAYFITHQWGAPYRTARIYQLLHSGSAFSVSDMLRIQTDIYSLEDVWLKQQLVNAAAARPPQSSDAQYALTILRDWDGRAKADSAATLVCEVTRRALLERILKPKLGDDLSGYRWPMSTTFLDYVLSQKWTRWLPPGDVDFDDTLMKSLEEAVRRIPQLVHGHGHGAWKWGETIPLTFTHPLGRTLTLLGHFLNVGPYPQAGTQTTVKQTTSTVGPSTRIVVDFSDFDNSVQNLTLGESGQAFSPHYRDQFDAWYNGRSFPMLFSDAAVDKGAAHELTLDPAGQTGAQN